MPPASGNTTIIAASNVARLEPLSFNDLAGWRGDDLAKALTAFRISARRMVEKPHTTKKLGIDAADLARAGAAALKLEPGYSAAQARRFFETWFHPYRIVPAGTADGETFHTGFVTGYFEPEIEASPVKTPRFRYPILARPDDRVEIDDLSLIHI